MSDGKSLKLMAERLKSATLAIGHPPPQRMAIINILRLAFVAATLLGFAPQANAAGTLRCVSLDYPPLIFAGADGKPQGIAVDVVNEVMSRAGWKVELEVLPWARALNLMQQGERDCIFTIFKTPERETFLDFSRKPLLQQPISLYAHKDSSIQFRGDLSKLNSKKWVVVRAVNYGEQFEAAKAGLKIDQAYTPTQAFLLVGNRHVDLTISNDYLAAYQLSTDASEIANNVVQLQPPVDVVKSYIGFAKGKHGEALRAFDSNIDQVVRADGGIRFKRILDKYKMPPSQRSRLLKQG